MHEELLARTGVILEHVQGLKTATIELAKLIQRMEAINRALRLVRFAGKKESVAANATRLFDALFSLVQSQIEKRQANFDFLGVDIKQIANTVREVGATFLTAAEVTKAA